MMIGTITLGLIAICLALFTFIYFYSTRKFKFWKQHDVTYIKPLPLIGSLKEVVFQKISVGYFLKNVYESYKGEAYVGIYSFDQPGAVILDHELVKKILVKDCQYFMDHMLSTDKDLDPLAARNLFMMKGQDWKNMRTYLSPTFTSGKMKNMFYLVEKCGKELEKYLESVTADGTPVEIKSTSVKFTLDVIASCAFGVDMNSLQNPDAEFPRHLKNALQFDTIRAWKTQIAIFAPRLLKYLRIKLFDADMYDFVRKTVWTTMNYRDEHGINRKDFLDSLRELKKKAQDPKDNNPFTNLEDDDCAAQAFTFLTAGSDTSATVMGFTIYELAINPEIQSRLRDEIYDVLEKHNNELTYEAMQEMKYLDMVVNEALRKYPSLPFLDRNCVKNYELPSPSGKGTIKIPPGTAVYIPLLGIHYDPQYYPDPEKFDPERFTDEAKQSRPSYTHMPFGEGPRMCIGMRFGLMQTKTGLIHIFSRFEVTPCKQTQIPMILDRKSFLSAAKGGITLSFKRIK